MRGNWPLVPTMDVVVPHTRTMTDMLEVLDVIVADDHDSRGDFWRTQPWIALPKASDVSPRSHRELDCPSEERAHGTLSGLRIAAPGMYIGEDHEAGSRESA